MKKLLLGLILMIGLSANAQGRYYKGYYFNSGWMVKPTPDKHGVIKAIGDGELVSGDKYFDGEKFQKPDLIYIMYNKNGKTKIAFGLRNTEDKVGVNFEIKVMMNMDKSTTKTYNAHLKYIGYNKMLIFDNKNAQNDIYNMLKKGSYIHIKVNNNIYKFSAKGFTATSGLMKSKLNKIDNLFD